MANLESSFDEAMLNIYLTAKDECDYNATYFLRMIQNYGGLGAAKRLLHDNKVHDGLTNLYMLERLDITMEAVIWENEKWQTLFTQEELKVARRRLEDLGYFSKP